MLYQINMSNITFDTIKKKRTDLNVGDIVELEKNIRCKITHIEEDTNGGIGYGDTWNCNICQELDDKLELKKDGTAYELLRGFGEVANNTEYDVLVNIKATN